MDPWYSRLVQQYLPILNTPETCSSDDFDDCGPPIEHSFTDPELVELVDDDNSSDAQDLVHLQRFKKYEDSFKDYSEEQVTSNEVMQRLEAFSRTKKVKLDQHVDNTKNTQRIPVDELREDGHTVVMPPVESALALNERVKRHYFFTFLEKGDLLCGKVIDVQKGDMIKMKMMCFDGGKRRELRDLEVTMYCCLRQLQDLQHSTEEFDQIAVGDYVRTVTISFHADSYKVLVSTSPDGLSEAQKEVGFTTGVITEEQLPPHYRRLSNLDTTTYNYSDMLTSHSQFNNPGSIPYLMDRLHMDESNRIYSMTDDLFDVDVSEEERAKHLRNVQMRAWATPHVHKGMCYFRDGKIVEALQVLNRALTINSSNVEGLIARGVLYSSQMNYMKAAEDFEHVLQIHPGHKIVKKYLSNMLVDYGDSLFEKDDEMAKSQYSRALHWNPNNKLAKKGLDKIDNPKPLFVLDRRKRMQRTRSSSTSSSSSSSSTSTSTTCTSSTCTSTFSSSSSSSSSSNDANEMTNLLKHLHKKKCPRNMRKMSKRSKKKRYRQRKGFPMYLGCPSDSDAVASTSTAPEPEAKKGCFSPIVFSGETQASSMPSSAGEPAYTSEARQQNANIIPGLNLLEADPVPSNATRHSAEADGDSGRGNSCGRGGARHERRSWDQAQRNCGSRHEIDRSRSALPPRGFQPPNFAARNVHHQIRPIGGGHYTVNQTERLSRSRSPQGQPCSRRPFPRSSQNQHNQNQHNQNLYHNPMRGPRAPNPFGRGGQRGRGQQQQVANEHGFVRRTIGRIFNRNEDNERIQRDEQRERELLRQMGLTQDDVKRK